MDWSKFFNVIKSISWLLLVAWPQLALPEPQLIIILMSYANNIWSKINRDGKPIDWLKQYYIVVIHNRYDDIKWASWLFQSPASQRYIQPLSELTTKKASNPRLLARKWGGSISHRCICSHAMMFRWRPNPILHSNYLVQDCSNPSSLAIVFR